MRVPRPTLAAVLLANSLALVHGVGEPKSQAPSAESLLGRVAQAYATCTSYRDSGVVMTTFIRAGGDFRTERPFTTAFVRPDRFRFEYRQKTPYGQEQRYIVWRSGPDIQTWWDVRPGVGRPASLSLALAGATGVSGGSAHNIPALLLPDEISGRRLTDISEAKLIEDGEYDSRECFRVEGNIPTRPGDAGFGVRPGATTLWVDKQTFVVLRIDGRTDFGDFRAESTTTYRAVIDGEVPTRVLESDPPKVGVTGSGEDHPTRSAVQVGGGR